VVELPPVSHPGTTRSQFAICNSDFIAFGASASHGTNALRISNDLRRATTGHSDTFGNMPLAPEEEMLFEVDAVEVIGFLDVAGGK
jgi:hypothetical protein